ncbi:MAG TPA: MFS transporter [Terriglobia bacterium]|nr:MFS transporter [Terriglobia bacterium]
MNKANTNHAAATGSGGRVEQPPAKWLNRNVVGMGLTSLLSDVSHEMATAVLPGFLAAMGISAAALGLIEGVADGVASFVKLASGWLSDRAGRRKPIAVGGYFVTGSSTALFALAAGWPLVLFGRALGWAGRGIRSPARNAILAASVPAESRGKAFGFERAGDTVGAILGPLIAVALLERFQAQAASPSAPFRTIFLLTLIPGLACGIVFSLLVRDKPVPGARTKFFTALSRLPNSFRRFLVGVGVFGMGDFAHTLMILAATELLLPAHGTARAAEIAALLYVGHNVVYAAASYPVGALSDRLGRRGLLAAGYLVGALVAVGLVAAFAWRLASISYLAGVFAVGGFYMAFEEALEGTFTADIIEPEVRGTAYGLLGAVNGIGDLGASIVVGGLWTLISPAVAFAYAAAAMLAGAALVYRLR